MAESPWIGPEPIVGHSVVIPHTTPGHDVPRVGQRSTIKYVSKIPSTHMGKVFYWVGLPPGDGMWASHCLGFKCKQETPGVEN